MGGVEERGGSGRGCCPGLQVTAALEGQLLLLAPCLDHLSVSAFPLPLPLLRSAGDHPPPPAPLQKWKLSRRAVKQLAQSWPGAESAAVPDLSGSQGGC